MRILTVVAALAAVVLAIVLVSAILERSDPHTLPAGVAPEVAADRPDFDEPSQSRPRSLASPPGPTEVPASPPPLASLPQEPTDAEIAALEVETPPGVMEGIVLRGREPLTTGGVVFFRPGYFSRLPEHPRDAGPQARLESAAIDGSGMFRIANLIPGNYTLAIDVGQGAQHETSVQLTSQKPGRRIVIVLGSARVSGHVYDEEGNPVADARVVVEGQFVRKGARSFRTSRSTRADGSYGFTDLPVGLYWFTVQLGGAWDSNDADSQQRLRLSAGEARVIDFGSTQAARTWSGTVRNRSGDPVQGGCRLHLTHSETGAYSVAVVEAESAFHVRLQRGEYSVHVSLDSDWEERIEVPVVRVGSADVNRDITIPGTRVKGTVIDLATGLPVQDYVGLRVGFRQRDAGTAGQGGPVDAAGRFAVDGVMPGVWLVSTHPLRLLVGDHEITVAESDVEIPLTLTVKSR